MGYHERSGRYRSAAVRRGYETKLAAIAFGKKVREIVKSGISK